ncbi:hypothetical protein [Novosphingobium sp. CECT 9465]|uniref:hypothetical protein n=1 Tax=Novosphingobium sp. CECT 9465 TaxID=2829794 RepID=UPI001E55434F|nr:hypothetical protein [Novosphingobium sp. CECT 9465]CAH0496477.1 hypothetical protein NVSP9465_01511 [Novosphingobium sp. CECT 9465]
MRKQLVCAGLTVGLAVGTLPARANNLGENGAWQFRSPTDLANLSLVLEAIEKKRAGGYAAPAYTTNIERQFNCGITASALGNSSGQSAVVNSPTATAASSSAQGNSGDSWSGRGGTISTSQQNSGSVGASATGDATALVNGSPTSVFNSTQTNSGVQSATVTGSTGCAFGVLN